MFARRIGKGTHYFFIGNEMCYRNNPGFDCATLYVKLSTSEKCNREERDLSYKREESLA